MKTKFGIVGCGFLGGIVANAWKNGLLPDYELVGVTSRTRASAEKLAAEVGCPVCDDVNALLTLQPEYIVETASVEAVRAMAVPVLKKGVNLVIISIGAFADLDFYEQVKAAAVEGVAKVHLASGAIGGFDVLQTVTLMAEAQHLAETAGIETHTGAKGFRNTPVWADHLLTDTEKTTVFTGNAKQAIATFPRRVNVAVATSLATTGPEITGVTMHSVPGWVGDDHCITAEIEGVKATVDICSSTSAIAGWSGASDIGRSKHLIVTDKDLFTARNISIESIRILGGAFPGKVITYAGSVIVSSGSCLAPVFTDLMQRNDCALMPLEDFFMGHRWEELFEVNQNHIPISSITTEVPAQVLF